MSTRAPRPRAAKAKAVQSLSVAGSSADAAIEISDTESIANPDIETDTEMSDAFEYDGNAPDTMFELDEGSTVSEHDSEDEEDMEGPSAKRAKTTHPSPEFEHKSPLSKIDHARTARFDQFLPGNGTKFPVTTPSLVAPDEAGDNKNIPEHHTLPPLSKLSELDYYGTSDDDLWGYRFYPDDYYEKPATTSSPIASSVARGKKKNSPSTLIDNRTTAGKAPKTRRRTAAQRASDTRNTAAAAKKIQNDADPVANKAGQDDKKPQKNLEKQQNLGNKPTKPKPSQLEQEDVADNEDNNYQSDEDLGITIPTAMLAKAQKKKPHNFDAGYSANLPPMSTSQQFFSDIGQKMIDIGVESLTSLMDGRPLNVGTFCSGTEAPILAMRFIKDYLATQGITFNFDQIISAEIHPAKSAFIERNYSPQMSARDITEILTQRENDPEWNTEWEFTTNYGGKIKVPGNLDVLIAGFCCDDFSTLNNHRKNLNQKGESGDTFFAVLEYVNRYRPKMVILENVTSAPWIDSKIKNRNKKKDSDPIIGIDKHFQDLGYETSFVKIDTKQFYLPHTRQRGYMVCILRDCFKGDITALQTLAKDFPAVINKLKRQASVPMEALLLDFDSPLANATKRDEGGKQRAAMPWAKCKLGHQQYIKAYRLGKKRPITFWRPDGYKVLPDYYSHNLVFTNRTTDYIDISHLRNISLKGVDDRYFSRFLELSQNVYRYEDTNRTGIIGCVTPANFLVNTQRGSRLSGLEALIAQGLDPDSVNIMNMSDALLNDLSGNAMTSTVVGTFMFAALINFRDVFDFEGRQQQGQLDEVKSEYLGENMLAAHMSHPTFYTPISVQQITALAQQTIRMCLCEGQNLVTGRHLQKCKICAATSCTKCGRNPVHHYEPLSVERKQPLEFEKVIKHALPFQIDLSPLRSNATAGRLSRARKLHLQPGFTRKSWNGMVNKIEQALSATVFYRSIRRAENFQVVYDSPQALLKLSVSSTGVEWQLYANVPDEPLATSTGKYLRRFPIARMRSTGQDLMKGDWQLWNPEMTTLPITITSSGPLEESFENERGLKDFSKTYVFSNISIAPRGNYSTKHLDQDILGDYVRSSECGQAWNSVHARKSADGQEPLLLFYNQHLHSGNPKNFFFSFTNDVARKRFAEELTVVCNLPSSWRQPTVIATGTDSHATVEGVPVAKFAGKIVEDVDICLNGHWVSIAGSQIGSVSQKLMTYHRLPARINHLQSSCQADKRAVFKMVAQLLHKPSIAYREDRWTLVTKANKAAFWKEYLCLLEKELVLAGHGEASKSWVHVNDAATACSSCSPSPPSMDWTFDTKSGRGFGKQIPVENPEQASSHERAIKNRPSAIEAIYRFSSSNSLELKVAINPVTLMHQATGSLLFNDTSSRTGELVGDGVQTSYRLVTDNGKSLAPTLAEFALRSTSDVRPLPTVVGAQSPFIKFSTAPIALLPAQSKAITWMLDQERKPKSFVEQVIAEASVEEIGYRLEGKATRQIKVAGGVLAQAVGFGKTILILSIVALQFKEAQERARNAPEVHGAIRTQATLVLVPPHLVDQWNSETQKFMDLLYAKVIVIKKATDFKRLTVGSIKNAVIVIASWDVCSHSDYQQAYAQFSGNVRYADNATLRAQREWHKHAAPTFAANVESLKSYSKTPSSFEDVLKSQFQASVAKTKEHSEYVPSKHVTGAKYVHALDKNGPKTGDKRKRLETSDCKFVPIFGFHGMADGIGIDGLQNPLLEMFKWNRVVIDEHTYAKAASGLLFEIIQGDAIWLLSGTPQLSNFHDVQRMAALLGINLGCDDHSVMKLDVLRKKMSEFTASEKFAMYQETPSTAWQQTRVQHAQAFLDQFVRQDDADVSGIEVDKRIIRVDQTPAEMALYMELMHHVVANDFQLNAIGNTSESKAQQIDEASSEGEDGKLALFLNASSFGLKTNKSDAADTTASALQLCQIIESTRAREYSEMLEDFKQALAEAHGLYVRVGMGDQTCTEYNTWLSRAQKNGFGDYDTTADILLALNGVQNLPASKKKTATIAGLRSAAAKLNTFCEELVIRNRSLRAFKSFLRVQSADELICSNCHRKDEPGCFTLLAGCGHLRCANCGVSDDCGVIEYGHSCDAPVAPHQRVSCLDLAVQARSESSSKFGSKIDYVVNLIQNKVEGHRILATEQVLVFVQTENVQKKLEEAFTASGIKSATLSNTENSSGILHEFQTRVSGVQVLIMLTASVTASGSNLTGARHLIFLGPLYTEGSSARQEYDSAMTQALGRSVRLGQKNTVVVYEILTTHTIDIDYSEHRGNQTLHEITGSDKLHAELLPTTETIHGPLSSAISQLTEFDG